MATNSADRASIAATIMRLGTGVIAIANPRGDTVDAILIKEPDYSVPAAPNVVSVWYEYTGDAAASAYGVTP